MRVSVVYLSCILTSAVGFIPVAPICGGARPRVGSLDGAIRSSSCSSSTKLSMGFDFKDMMEKMSDSRYARVRHILVDEKGEEGRARLEEVKEVIGGDLEKFSAEAERISTCSSAPRGGRLKLLARGETVPEFDEVAFKGELGVVHGPIETSFGTHLIWIESCNKPQNTWKMLFDDVVKGIKGDGGEEA